MDAYIGSALLAGLVLALVESAFLLEQANRPLLQVVLALMAALGLVVGLVLAFQEWLVARLSLESWRAALVRALGSVLPLYLTCATLFDGAYASSLPGASLAHLWIPALGYAVLVGLLVLAGRVATNRRARMLLALALLILVAACEWGNRTLFGSGYPRVHTFLVLTSCVGLTLVTLLLWPRRGAGKRSPAARLGIAAALAAMVVVGCAVTFASGLSSRDDRMTVATRGNHTRHLTRLVRQLGDRDGDGYSRLLGGGDCDDSDPSVNPGAGDTPGNGQDEDCDGIDPDVPAAPSPDPSQPDDAPTLVDVNDIRAQWYASQSVRELLQQTRSYNLVLLSVDTLRSDTVPPRAPASELPHLSRLLAESVHFVRAFTPASGTDVSLGSLVTGRIDPFQVLQPTLAEAMRSSGRTSHAVIPREVLRYAGETLLTRGFDSHDVIVSDRDRRDIGSHSTGAETTGLGLRFLDQLPAGQRFFLWLHYFDVHEHHQLSLAELAPERHASPALRQRIDAEGVSKQERVYRASTAAVDHAIGHFLDEIRARDLDRQTIVVFFSDHGESLGEDERLPEHHGYYLYNALVHVPVSVRIPGLDGRQVSRPMTLTDLFPTLLELVGEPVPEATDGHSLLADIAPAAPAALRQLMRPLVLNETNQWAVIDWPYKLLVRPEDNLFELYDLERDFHEQDDLAPRERARVAALKQLYLQYPSVSIDRSRKGRNWRERQAQPPQPR